MILEKLARMEDLTPEEAESVMDGIMGGRFTSAQVAAILVALRMKGESLEEIAALARVMRRHSLRISPKAQPLVDTCGTGGDGSGSFNISTTAALIASGSGITIAKHGNRAVSGKCGSADVLEELGVRMLGPEGALECIERNGIGFLFAPLFHPAMKKAMPVRRELGIRTVFNILGPLANPANARSQVLGVYSPELTERMAEVLRILGSERALVVNSEGMDELGLGKTRVSELRGGNVETYELDASEYGFAKQQIPQAPSKEDGARVLLSVLAGQEGAARDISLLNAAAAIYAGGRAKDMECALDEARESVDSGAAMRKLEALRAFGGG